jgi:DNA-binding response OmpR family regulator
MPMKTILAVDDDRWVLETLKDALAIKGYEVLTADHADVALDVLKQRSLDLVLLDLNMPGKNGFQFYNELSARQETPVLFVSGCSRSFSPKSPGFKELWTEKFSLGHTDILYKPFALSLLFEKVEALVGEAEVAQNGQAL